MSLLSVVQAVDNFPYSTPSQYYSFLSHNGTLLGYMTPDIAQLFAEESQAVTFDSTSKTVQIKADLKEFEDRNQVFAEVATRWRKLAPFKGLLDAQWRDELYCVYNPTSIPYLLLERAFSVLLGVATYGVHMVAFVPPLVSSTGKLRLWVPRRAATKPTYPLKLDNTVAGGIGYPYKVLETLLKECEEEAGLPELFVKDRARPAGVVSYMHMPFAKGYPTETGKAEDFEGSDEETHQEVLGNSRLTVQPEVEFVYDMELKSDDEIAPHPVDGEVDSFSLMDVDEVIERAKNGEFKPNCGLLMVDFLVRHGFILADTEEGYMEILQRCHRRFPFATMT